MSDQLAHFSITPPLQSPTWTWSPFSLSLHTRNTNTHTPSWCQDINLWLYNVARSLHKQNRSIRWPSNSRVCERLVSFVGKFTRDPPEKYSYRHLRQQLSECAFNYRQQIRVEGFLWSISKLLMSFKLFVFVSKLSLPLCSFIVLVCAVFRPATQTHSYTENGCG